MTLDQVSQAVGANGANAGGGLLRRGDEALVIRSIGLYARLEDIRGAVIAARNGRPILVSDVAEVDIGPRPLSGMVAFNERDSIVEGIVQMTKGNDAAKVVADLKARIADVAAKLPPGVTLRPDLRAHPAHPPHRARRWSENLALGAALVIAILIAFLQNWRAALIVGSVIPLALLVAFILMDARGVSANLISLGAVDFGIIIDSAVVLVEALMVRLAAGIANRDYAHRIGGAAADGGRARPPDPVLQGDHHHRLSADLHFPARRRKDFRAGGAHPFVRAGGSPAADADAGAGAAVVRRAQGPHGGNPFGLAGAPAGSLSRPARPRICRIPAACCWCRSPFSPRRSRARRCSAPNSCPSWTRATSG